MNVMRQSVGNAVAEWQEDEPLRWVMRETRGEGKHATERKLKFDLTPLLAGYSRIFLLMFKEYLVKKRLRVSLTTVKNRWFDLRCVFRSCQDHFARVCEQEGIARVVFDRIDSDFLLGISAIKDELPAPYLESLRAFYTEHRDNPALFSPDLQLGDFPTVSGDIRSRIGRTRQNVLASTLSRSVLVEILNITEAAYEMGTLDLGRYAFSRLMLSRAARPETYRMLRCKDLRVDTGGGVKNYFLTLTIPKAKTATRPQATVSIHREVGRLLEKQREAVARRLGHLVESKNAALSKEGGGSPLYTIGDLPLFPLVGDSRPKKSHPPRKGTIDRLGMYDNSGNFTLYYVNPLRDLTGKEINCTAMRHTMATQLAIAGGSAGTIAAVLLHANEKTAKVYVDLIFDGAIDELSDSMEGAFSDHFPVFKEFVSVQDPIEPESRIVSHSTDRMRHETTGACGRHRICEYAPLSCYDCHRFKPAYDVDHTINLDLVTEEIDAARGGGLQRQTDLRRYTHIANRIRIVINVCELKLAAKEAERSIGGAAR